MSSIDFRISAKQREAGMVAIMVTLILMIVISLIVLGFAQISRRNQRQALDRQLSTQAFYAAETGVNDAAELIRSALTSGSGVPAKPDCQSNGGGFYAGLNPVIDAGSAVEYTCLTVEPAPTTLEYPSIGTASRVIPLLAANSSIDSITLVWKSLDTPQDNPDPAADCRPNLTDPFLTSSAWIATGCGYGVLRFDLVPTAGGLSIAGLQNSTMTTFVVPLRPGASGATSSIDYPSSPASAAGVNSRVGVICSSDECRLTINNLSASQYHMRVSSLYKNVSLQISARNTSDSPVNLQGTQAVIDVTGKAQDVLRRIQVRIPLTTSGTNLLSDYAIQSSEAICKRFSIMDNFFRNEADNAVPGVQSSTTNQLCRQGPQG